MSRSEDSRVESHSVGGNSRSEAMKAFRKRLAVEAGDIPIEEFQKTLLALKSKHEWTWAQVASLTGRKISHISAIAHDKNKKTIKRETAEDILSRLAGAARVVTEQQKAEYTALSRRDQADQRAETLREKKLAERRANVAKLRDALG